MEQTFDLTPCLAKTFASNNRVQKLFNKIYETNRDYHNMIAKKNEFYNCVLITGDTLENQVKAQRNLAIVMLYLDECSPYFIKDNKWQLKIIDTLKGAWNTLYNRIENYPDKHISYETFVRKYIDIDSTPEIEFTYLVTLFFIFCHMANKTFDTNERMINKHLVYLANNMNTDSLIERLKTTESYFKRIGLLDRSKEVLNCQSIRGVRSILLYENKYPDDLFYALSLTVSRFSGIPLTLFDDQNLSKQELKLLCYCIVASEQEMGRRWEDKELKHALLLGLIIFNMNKSYIKLKEETIEQSNLLTSTPEHKELISEIEELKIKLASAESKLREKDSLSAAKQEIINGNQNQINRLNKQFNSTEKELQNKIKELQEENEILKSLAEREDMPEAMPIDLDALKNLKAIVFGGHDNWQANLKKKLPDYTYVAVDNLNYNSNLLDNFDTVIFNYKYVNHAHYYKIIEKVRRTDKKIIYSGNSIRRLLEDLMKLIKD